VGTFEEEEEGTGLASDVVEVEGEDLATPVIILDLLTRGHPGTITIPQYQVNKTKKHTHPRLSRSADTRKPRDRNDSPISDE